MNIYESIKAYSEGDHTDFISKDFKTMKNMSEDEIEDYLYEITQSLSREEAQYLIGSYLDMANKAGYSYGAPLFKTLLAFYNKLK